MSDDQDDPDEGAGDNDAGQAEHDEDENPLDHVGDEADPPPDTGRPE